MSQNAKQNQNSRTTPTMPVKIPQPVGDVSPDDPVGVTSGETGKPPVADPEGPKPNGN